MRPGRPRIVRRGCADPPPSALPMSSQRSTRDTRADRAIADCPVGRVSCLLARHLFRQGGTTVHRARKPQNLPDPAPAPRAFLFLQGPPGPFFRLLAEALVAAGHRVFRINLNGGDAHDWGRDVTMPATNYRGRASRWALFVDAFLRDHAITDVILFGDCRPLHIAAHRMARLRGIPVHVFEEGYIRPDWLTLEREGVNGHSRLTRDPDRLLVEGRDLPMPPSLPHIGATLRRRVRDCYWYFHHVVLGWLLLTFPFYRSHRPGSVLAEGAGWFFKLVARERTARRADVIAAGLETQRYFLFPLQLSSDYQIRIHSPFSSMQQAADFVLASFAAFAPPDVKLVVKEHPLDARFFGWGGYVRARARALGLADRLIHIAGGDLQALAEGSLGMVVVNSTSATFALPRGVPVVALGRAIYAIPGITHQGRLDDFWTAPQAPDPALYDAFQRVLHRTCLVRGGLASQSGTAILVAGSVERLLGPEA